MSAIFGYNIDGKLSIDNERGNNVYKSEYNSSLSLGLTAQFRFKLNGSTHDRFKRNSGLYF